MLKLHNSYASNILCTLPLWILLYFSIIGLHLHRPTERKTYTCKNAINAARTCPTSNIDVALLTFKGDFILAGTLLRSIDAFMPCHGLIHILVDLEDALRIRSWINTENPDVRVHVIDLAPVKGANLSNFIQHAWVSTKMDEYAKRGGSKADYLLYMDTDSILAAPVTCNSLFDGEGKLYLPGWSFRRQKQFIPSAEMIANGTMKNLTSYMSFFPFVLPMPALPRMRKSIALHLSSGTHSDYDRAFIDWANRPDIKSNDWCWTVPVGLYLQLFETELVHPIFCANNGHPHNNSECSDYVASGAHYGWRYCYYLNSCFKYDRNAIKYHRRSSEGKDQLPSVSGKLSQNTIDFIEESMQQGICFKEFVVNGTVLPQCENGTHQSLHPDLMPYPMEPPSFESLKRRFAPESENEDLCPSVLVKQRNKN